MWCWWCCHPYETPEIHLPYDYDPMTKRFKTMGAFCSWACVKAYNLDRGGPKLGEYQQYATLMRRHMYGKVIPLKAAPKRQALKVFGGTLTIDEFRSSCVDPPNIQMPFEIYFLTKPPTAHEIVQTGGTTLKRPAVQMKTIEDSTASNDQLKLKRSKPLARENSSLEKALGIQRVKKA
jgi:hypothetical protein